MMGGISYDTHYKTIATTKQLLSELREDENEINPIDYTECQLTQNAFELIPLTRRAYVVQKLRDLAYEIEMQGRIA